ncbi:MAG: PilZ domain-containing protein [Gammaproteobacteria bacterium]
MSDVAAAGTHDERRHAARRAVRLPVAWHDGQRARQGTLLDASDAGVFLLPAWRPSDALVPGTTLELRCRVQGGELDLSGEVCWLGRSDWHDAEGFGLRIHTTAALRELLDALAD